MATNTPKLVPSYTDLLEAMIRREPLKRPSAAEALESLMSIIADLPSCIDGNTVL